MAAPPPPGAINETAVKKGSITPEDLRLKLFILSVLASHEGQEAIFGPKKRLPDVPVNKEEEDGSK
jgi:hypothetical protein